MGGGGGGGGGLEKKKKNRKSQLEIRFQRPANSAMS